jgi:hypothetical protein
MHELREHEWVQLEGLCTRSNVCGERILEQSLLCLGEIWYLRKKESVERSLDEDTRLRVK